MSSKPSSWVMIRGLAREAGHWGDFVEQMKAGFPGDEVLAIDLPGMGEFRNLSSPHSIGQIAEFLRERAIERTSLQTQFNLMGVSLGGMVAMEWMRRRPEDLAKVVLINSSSSRVSPPTKRIRWEVWPQVIQMMVNQSVREREKQLIDLLINDPQARERALSQWIRIGNEHPPTYLNVLKQLWAARGFKVEINGNGVPVLVLVGLGDRFVDPSCSIALGERNGWATERHSWGGHDLSWDDPEWIIDKIRAWQKITNASQ